MLFRLTVFFYLYQAISWPDGYLRAYLYNSGIVQSPKTITCSGQEEKQLAA